MTQTILLGPLALPAAFLLALVAFLAARHAGMRLAGAASPEAERQLLRIALLALLVARGAFVLQYLDDYAAAPLRIVDIRDGGWTWAAGLAAGAAALGVLAWRRATLRKPLLAAAATGVLVWGAGALGLAATQDPVPRMPQLALRALDGSVVELSAFSGKPTVVNLWATWCGPCRREMPVLQQAQAARPDVQFVFLNQGEPADKVQAYLAASGLALRNVLLDAHGEAGATLGHKALPATLFFDARGRLVDTRVGELSPASLRKRLEAISGP